MKRSSSPSGAASRREPAPQRELRESPRRSAGRRRARPAVARARRRGGDQDAAIAASASAASIEVEPTSSESSAGTSRGGRGTAPPRRARAPRPRGRRRRSGRTPSRRWRSAQRRGLVTRGTIRPARRTVCASGGPRGTLLYTDRRWPEPLPAPLRDRSRALLSRSRLGILGTIAAARVLGLEDFGASRR